MWLPLIEIVQQMLNPTFYCNANAISIRKRNVIRCQFVTLSIALAKFFEIDNKN